MKRISILLVSTLYILVSCKKNTDSTSFDYQKAAGTWVPYEIVASDGTIQGGPFTNSTIFGVYAESVRLYADHTFTPVIWTSSTNFFLKVTDNGTYQYNRSRNSLVFDGVFQFEFVVERVEDNELWLQQGPILYKLRRQL